MSRDFFMRTFVLTRNGRGLLATNSVRMILIGV